MAMNTIFRAILWRSRKNKEKKNSSIQSKSRAAGWTKRVTLYLPLRPSASPELCDLPFVEPVDMRLPVTIYGYREVMHVKAAATDAIMSYEKAEKLGLIDRIESYRRVTVKSWTTVKQFTIGIVTDVPVLLNNDLTLLVDFRIWPKGYDAPFVLDNATLRRNGAVHALGDANRIYFLPYTDLSERPRRCLFALEANTSLKSSGLPVQIVVSTDSRNVMISKKLMNKLKEQLPRRKKIKKIRIQSTSGEILYECKVKVGNDMCHDMVIGSDVLDQNSCIIDYFSSMLYFNTEKMMVADMTEISYSRR